jgi:hypothetical protein
MSINLKFALVIAAGAAAGFAGWYFQAKTNDNIYESGDFEQCVKSCIGIGLTNEQAAARCNQPRN